MMQQIAEWKENCESQLLLIQPPEICTDINCSDINCHNKIDTYTQDIIQTLNNSCKAFLPSSNPTSRNKCHSNLPGWNDYVQPYKLESIFHHSLWISNC